MARPMILIKKELLQRIALEAGLGVPVAALTTNHLKSSISPPTLNKILSHYATYLGCIDNEAKAILEASLFPAWLADSEDRRLAIQPTSYRYDGVFPLGRWIKT